MTRNENQMHINATGSQGWSVPGVTHFATHTPLYTPPVTGGSSYGAEKTTHAPSHNRIALIGATSLALLLAAMGGIAYLRAQETVVPTALPLTAPVAATAVVPHGALAALDATVVMEPASGMVAVSVPHAALAALDATAVVAPASGVVAVSVPHAALAEYADALSDAPEAATVAVPRGAVPVE